MKFSFSFNIREIAFCRFLFILTSSSYFPKRMKEHDYFLII